MTLTQLQKAPFPYFADGTVEVRADGSIWRLRRYNHPCEPIRIDNPDGSKGYRNTRLPDETGQWRTYKAHRLVWQWHYGTIPEGMQVNHRNGVKSDNRIGNLELVTQSENIRHSYAMGRPLPWHSSTQWRGKPRVSPEVALRIQSLRSGGMTLRAIGDLYGISTSHVSRVARKKGGPGE